MSVDYHKEGCEIGNLHPDCDHPDCVAGRVWDEMRRVQQEPICRMTAAERAATMAKRLEAAEEMLRPDPDVMIGGEG